MRIDRTARTRNEAATRRAVTGLLALALAASVGAAEPGKGQALRSGTSPCVAVLGPASASVEAAGAVGRSVSVTVPPGCAYESKSLDGFITVTTGAAGTGSGSLTYRVAPNPGEARQGAILIGGTTFVVDQAKRPPARATAFDFDGDGKADIGIFRPSTGTWYVLEPTGSYSSTQWGVSSDTIVAADFDGDGKTDVAIYRPSNGTWYIVQSRDGFKSIQWGSATDIPVPADYDGDGKADVAIYRPSNGTWYVLQSRDGFKSVQWGVGTDIPVPGDYDGDGRADVAIYRPSSGTWYIVQSRDGFKSVQWGFGADIPVPADYDGDGKANVAIYRPSSGTWYVVRPDGGADATQFGVGTDVPLPATARP